MFGSLRKSISKTISRATEIITGSGPTPAKQFRNAIVDGDEDKAIVIYTTTPKEGTKCLFEELHPSMPFPSKKQNISDTPLSLASKYALEKLVILLLEHGGDPGALHSTQETCIHAVCCMSDKPEVRASIIEHFMSWNNGYELGLITEKVSVNKVDINGNTAIHNAASTGLVSCVEKLVTYGAIISIVNKGNNTCCELADSNGHKNLAMMLELALVFQAEEFDLSQFDAFSIGNVGDRSGKLYLDTQSITIAGIHSFVEEAVEKISVYLGWMDARRYRSRAEALLNGYAWEVDRLRKDLIDNGTKVLSNAKMDPATFVARPTIEENLPTSTTKDLNTSVVPSAAESTNADEISIDIADGEMSGKTTVVAVSSTASPVVVAPEPVLCTICCEEMLPEQDISFHVRNHVEGQGRHCLTCLSGHSYCLDCWSSHLTVQVSENGLGYMPCPGYKCGEILELSWAPVLLKSQDLVNRLRNQRARHVADCAGFKTCPVEGCGLQVHIPKQIDDSSEGQFPSSSLLRTPGSEASVATGANQLPLVAMCDNNHMFCVSCFQTAHSPCTCMQFPQWFQLVREETQTVGSDPNTTSGDDLANALWVAANTKRCPRCGTAIEKDEGCNHMSCRKCRKEFCWICMQDWSLHSENTGGYFQCNRFQDASARNNSSEIEAADPWVEERGNAHAETLRMRQRNRRMARFIHHFTRFQAHGQSFQMESRMSKDTYKRIEDGLKASLNGQLKWLPGDIVPNPMTTSTTTSPRSHNNNQSSFGGVGLKETAISPLEAALGGAARSYQESGCTQDNLSNLLAVETGDVLCRHYVKPSAYLQFLSDGFHELLKCRQFLQWTYPYAYFEFEDSDHSDYSTTRKRGWQHRAQDHRTSFELMQADLESTVETLSDVCARRRLRASRAQIIQATQAAKQKRIDFESLLFVYAIAKQQFAQQQQTSNSSSTTPGRRWTATPGTSGSRHRSRLRSTPSAHRHARMEDDNIDEIANLIRGLELATGSFLGDNATRPAVRTTPTPNDGNTLPSGTGTRRSTTRRFHRRTANTTNNNNNSSDSQSSSDDMGRDDDEDIFSIRNALERSLFGHDISAEGSTSNSATGTNDSTTSGNDRSSRRQRRRQQRRNDEQDLLDDVDDDTMGEAALAFLRLTEAAEALQQDQTFSSVGEGGSTGTIASPTSRPNRAAGSAGHTPDSHRLNLSNMSEARLARLAQRAEEEEQLNRAILLSLRSEPAGGRTRGPSEQNITTLEAMGFERERAVQALQDSGDDVEAAAMQLLG